MCQTVSFVDKMAKKWTKKKKNLPHRAYIQVEESVQWTNKYVSVTYSMSDSDKFYEK